MPAKVFGLVFYGTCERTYPFSGSVLVSLFSVLTPAHYGLLARTYPDQIKRGRSCSPARYCDAIFEDKNPGPKPRCDTPALHKLPYASIVAGRRCAAKGRCTKICSKCWSACSTPCGYGWIHRASYPAPNKIRGGRAILIDRERSGAHVQC